MLDTTPAAPQRSRVLLAGVAAASIATLAGACRRDEPAVPAVVTLAGAAAGPDAAPSASVDAGAVRARGALPRTFACGAATCRVGMESCCADGSGVGVCVRTVPPGPDEEVQHLASQIAACGEAKLEFSLAAILRCDDADDCGQGETCCGQFLYGGAESIECQRLAPGAACELGERCRPDVPCRTPGSRCIDGRCEKDLSGLRCGAGTCAHDEICCGKPLACVSRSACTTSPRYRCTGPRDCLRGEHCSVTPMGSYCTGLLDTANASVACDADTDCPDAVCPPGQTGKHPRCVPGPWSGLGVCECR